MDYIDSMEEQMGIVSRETEILRKNQKETLAIKHTAAETRNASDGLFRRPDTAEGGL